MGERTGISWTNHTFSPWWGCYPVSSACENCYARRLAARFGYEEHWRKRGPRRFFGPKHWSDVLSWDRKAGKDGVRRSVFCASMCDVFEDREDLAPERLRLWGLIKATHHLDWLLLTKRPENVASMVPEEWAGEWPAAVWIGITAENQTMYEARSYHLRKLPASVKCFVSLEPLLGPIQLGPLGPIKWVIVGGETGPDARPMSPGWVRLLLRETKDAGIPFHFKAWGEWRAREDAPLYSEETGEGYEKIGSENTGRELDGRVWDEIPGEEKGAV